MSEGGLGPAADLSGGVRTVRHQPTLRMGGCTVHTPEEREKNCK